MIWRVQGIEVGDENRSKIDQKMESRWEGILGSIFNGFWWIFGGKLGRKMEPRSTQEGIEKTMEKWIAPRWPQNRNKTQQRLAGEGVQSPGEGVGGGASYLPAARGIMAA